MPSVDISQIAKLAKDTGYETFDAAYKPEKEFFRQLATVKAIGMANAAPFGHRMVGSGDIGALEERRPGQRYPADTVEQGYVRQVAIRERAKEIVIPMEAIDRVGGEAAFKLKVVDLATSFAARAAQYKDEVVAGILQYGTIAAGNTTYFDNGYPDNPDSNIGKIYDGKPLYAASGNAHPLAHATVSGSQGINLIPTSADLDATTFAAAYTAFTVHNAIDERGLPVDNIPRFLVGGAAMQDVILKFLNSEKLPGTAQNDINPWRGTVDPLIWPRLSIDANAWWLHDPAALLAFEGPLMIDSRFDPAIKSMVVTCSVMFGCAPVDWRKTLCNNKATT